MAFLKRKKKEGKKESTFRGIEFQYFMRLRLANTIVITIFFFASIWVGYFVYHRIHNTIGQVQSIIVLRSQMSTEVIDFQTLERLEETWVHRFATSTPALTNDPFTPPPPPEPEVSE